MDTNTALNDNALHWCNGNYELVYSSLQHLRRYARTGDPKVPEKKDSSRLGFFQRFLSRCSNKFAVADNATHFRETGPDECLSGPEDQDLDELYDHTLDLTSIPNLQALKEAVVDSMKKSNFHRPRLVPRRRQTVTREELSQYITSRFKDLLQNLDSVEDYSRSCDVDQFLCCELLYEGLFYYGVNDSQSMPEFTIIENMLHRQALFQLKSLRLLFSFVNGGEVRTTDKFDKDPVFPEALDLLKHLVDQGLLRNLFVLLLSTIKETHRFYLSKRDDPEKSRTLDPDRMDYTYSFNADADYDLAFTHSAAYLNLLLDLLTTYYLAFVPTKQELEWLMAFLPHLFDYVKMFGLPEFTNSLSLLFRDYAGDTVSASYPNSLRAASIWVSAEEFDTACNSHLTYKLSTLLMVMINTKIYRLDTSLNVVRLNEGFMTPFKLNPHALLYRGVFDPTFDPSFQPKDSRDAQETGANSRPSLENPDYQRFDQKKRAELEKTREEHKELEVILDFVVYGVYLDDVERALHGFSSNVMEAFLNCHHTLSGSPRSQDSGYLPLYSKFLRTLFTPLFIQGKNLSRTWYDLLNYEVTCKRKIEDLSRTLVQDRVHTAVFREPGATLIHTLELFSKVYGEKDAEFLYKLYKSVAESYNSLVPNRPSLLFTTDTTSYKGHYYRLDSRRLKREDSDLKLQARHEHPTSSLYNCEPESEANFVKLNSKELDHLLLFPNQGFSWHERNTALLDLVSLACKSRNIFVKTYPRLHIVLLEFSVFLSTFPSLAPSLASFLNTGSCRELQFPQLLQAVVAQLKCLKRGDLELLPQLIYDQIIARDDRIETAEAAMDIVTTMPSEYNGNHLSAPGFEDTSGYLQHYFKRSKSHSTDAYNATGYWNLQDQYGEGQVKQEYLKDVDGYRIHGVKREDFQEPQTVLKPDRKRHHTRQYTFPLVNTHKEVRKALSNLGLGGPVPYGLVEAASLVFKLIQTLDPLKSNGEECHEDRDSPKGDRLEGGKNTENTFLVNLGGYKYLDVLFSILGSRYTKGTELLVGSLLKSVASAHVTDFKVCRESLVKLNRLLHDPSSTLGRRLNRYELTNLCYCLTSLLSHLPLKKRYLTHPGESDYLLDLTRYVLGVLDLELLSTASSHAGNPETGISPLQKFSFDLPRAGESDLYPMMDWMFSFLLLVSKGPLGLANTSRATQHLYEQILLPGSSVTYLLIKSANEARLMSAVSLVCNVFKRDFLVLSLHKVSKFNLNKENSCPNCKLNRSDELVHKNVDTKRVGPFTWFMNKIHLISPDRTAGSKTRPGYEAVSVQGRVACEACSNLDFNQRPLSLLLAHEAFMEALSVYSQDLTCDMGNLSSRDVVLRLKTLYILLQLLKRNRKLHLNTKLLTRFKCYLYQFTFKPAQGGSKHVGSPDKELYQVLNDPDMESSDLVLYNKLKYLTQVDFDRMTSFSNLRELQSCTFKTLVTYFFTLEPELQSRVVDERLFLSMVRACKEPWEGNSWYKLYLLAIVARLATHEEFAKMLLLSWPTLFTEMQNTEFKRTGDNALVYSKLAYQLDIVASFAGVLNKLHKNGRLRTNNPDALDRFGEETRTRECSLEDMLSLLDLGGLDFTALASDLISHFAEHELLLYNNIMDRAGSLDLTLLTRLWSYNSYVVSSQDMLIKLISHHSLSYTGDGRLAEDEALEEYANVTEMYNTNMLAFTALFQRVLGIFESLDFLKLETHFDHVDGNDFNDFKFLLQLSLVKRLYAHKNLNAVSNILAKLLNHLLRVDGTDDILRAKIYHVVNCLLQNTGLAVDRLGHSNSNLNLVLTRLLISHLSQHNGTKCLLDLLFKDSTRDFTFYGNLEVLGYAILPVPESQTTEAHSELAVNAQRDSHTGDLSYFRSRCLASLNFSLEGMNLNCTVEALNLLSALIRGLATFEASRVEFDSGTLFYGHLGTVSVESVKRLVKKRLLGNFYLCNQCVLTPPMCMLCNTVLTSTLNVLHSVATLHQFGSFWFNTKLGDNESLSDMFLKSSFLTLFDRPQLHMLLPTLFVVEHLLSTTSIKTRNAIITWLNQYCDVLLHHLNGDLYKFEVDSKVYICCLLRVYRITFLWLLSDYRGSAEYKDNFTLILADLHCKFPLASALPRLVPNLLGFFVNHLDSDLNWLCILLCLQTFFPELGAFEMDLSFTAQVPIKTKALELVKLLVEVMLKCSNGLLWYMRQYSRYIRDFKFTPDLSDLAEFCEAGPGLEYLDNLLVLKVVTLDCCVILLEYILSLVKLPNTVGIDPSSPELSRSKLGVAMKLDDSDRLRLRIEKLAKVCTANGASVANPGHSRESLVEFLAPYQLEHVPSFSKRLNYSHKTLFSTLLASLLNLDSVLAFYT